MLGSSVFSCVQSVVTQFSPGSSKRLPAQKTGGRYKTCYEQGVTVL